MRAKIYLGYLFRADAVTRYEKSGLRVEGTICWTLSEAAGKNANEFLDYLTQWDQKGYKTAFLIKKGQRIDQVAYARSGGGELLVLSPDDRVTDEVERVLGTPPGYVWAGFVSSEGRRKFTFIEPNVVCFEVTLRIAPAETEPQLIPMVSRHLEGSFENAYMPGLWVLPKPGA
jgi:hypothetical protein